MRIHPFLAAATLTLAAVTALAASAVVEHRRARARRWQPPPEIEEAPPAPRRAAVPVQAPRPRAAAPPPAAPPPAALRVHVTGPHGITLEAADVSLHRPGEDDVVTSLDEEDDAPGTYSADDLEAGRYDVEITADGMRTARLGAATGPRTLEVALERAPILLGAVGRLGGEGCAGVAVRWSGPDDEAGEVDPSPESCTFAIDLPDEGPITVVAARGAREERALVSLPLTGDPAPICLAPPCAADPALLLAFVADAAGQPVAGVTVTWTLQSDGLRGEMGTTSGPSGLRIEDRRPGQTIAIHAERGRDTADAIAVLGAGVTEVVLTLPVASSEDDSDEPVEAFGVE
jgi:hypothetical protein